MASVDVVFFKKDLVLCYVWTIRSAYKVPLMKTQRVLALLKSRG
jgi:hypothetical protein